MLSFDGFIDPLFVNFHLIPASFTRQAQSQPCRIIGQSHEPKKDCARNKIQQRDRKIDGGSARRAVLILSARADEALELIGFFQHRCAAATVAID